MQLLYIYMEELLGYIYLVQPVNGLHFIMTVTIIGATSHLNSHFGVGTGPVFIQRSSCSWSETSLLGCSIRYLPTYACNHYQDVGVTCEGMLYIIFVNIIGF